MSYQNTVDSTNAHLAESDKHSVNSSSHRDPDTQAANISAYTMSVPVASITSRMDIEALAQPSQTLSTAQSEGKTQAKDSKLVEEVRDQYQRMPGYILYADSFFSNVFASSSTGFLTVCTELMST